MKHSHELPLSAIQFYVTAPYSCSYLPDKMARSQVAVPSYQIQSETFSDLVDQGFRRSGHFTYRPHCDSCQACVPIRIDCAQFVPNRTQRKIWRRQNDHLQTHISALRWADDHYELYCRYQRARHPGGGMDDDSRSQYRQFLLTTRVNSRLVEFRDSQQRLLMVSIIDILSHGLSSVYTFYDPDSRGSLGTYGILWQIEQCRQQNLPWLYLGYWIKESDKMSYKSHFSATQYRYNGHWVSTPPHELA